MTLWRYIRANLRRRHRKIMAEVKRLQDSARAEKTRHDMLNAWTPVIRWEREMVFSRGEKKGRSAGVYFFIGEINGIGDRRLRTLFEGVGTADEKDDHQASKEWARAVRWRERIEDLPDDSDPDQE